MYNSKISNLRIKVIHFIANCVESEIRGLEGVLNKITAFFSLSKKKIDITLVKNILKDRFFPNKPGVKFKITHYYKKRKGWEKLISQIPVGATIKKNWGFSIGAEGLVLLSF